MFLLMLFPSVWWNNFSALLEILVLGWMVPIVNKLRLRSDLNAVCLAV